MAKGDCRKCGNLHYMTWTAQRIQFGKCLDRTGMTSDEVKVQLPLCRHCYKELPKRVKPDLAGCDNQDDGSPSQDQGNLEQCEL